MSRPVLEDGFDWFDVLLKAGNDPVSVSFNQHVHLTSLAQGWPTCACGQLCAALPRNNEGCPLDGILRDLGLVFLEHVRNKEWCKAFTTFQAIEKRTDKLLQEQEAEACMLS